MIQDHDIERPADLVEPLGRSDILFARARIAARVIVDENDPRGIEFERALENCSRIDRELGERSMLELLVSEEPPRPVDEQYAQHLDRKRAHRRDQILTQLRVEGVDHLGAKVAPHPLDHHVTRTDQERHHRRVRAENAAKGFGRLRPDAAQAVEFSEQLFG
ncbi:MAG: hypothetical protein Q8R44_02375 [Novosphingobium sp.]|nr:hypothetical protein [Novosphingobium sp.]